LAGCAESLPFDNNSFDAAMAVCTVHHWQDPIAGLRGMRHSPGGERDGGMRAVEAFLQPLRVVGELMHLDDVRE
jgi:ubiquinone/menaquinone biosynthesis C-methylase UbiE